VHCKKSCGIAEFYQILSRTQIVVRISDFWLFGVCHSKALGFTTDQKAVFV